MSNGMDKLLLNSAQHDTELIAPFIKKINIAKKYGHHETAFHISKKDYNRVVGVLEFLGYSVRQLLPMVGLWGTNPKKQTFHRVRVDW